ncbi:MAG: hypothetical protein K2X66_08220, partial [Cyanobacteria bacterium]|nr:hypothetical protein [Cyanobacteriota bacterium]
PILPPSRNSPVEAVASVYEGDWVPGASPLGQIYDPTLHPTDLDHSNFKQAIERLVQKRILPIEKTGLFYPEQSLTRGEALLWLYNTYAAHDKNRHSLSQPVDGVIPSTTEETSNGEVDTGDGERSLYASSGKGTHFDFSKDGQRPYYQLLSKKLRLLGVMDGYDELLMHSEWPINREEFAALVWAFTNYVVSRDDGSGTSNAKVVGIDTAQMNEMEKGIKKYYPSSLEDITPSYLLGVGYLISHKRGNLYQNVFLMDVKNEAPHLDPQKVVTKEQAAGLIDRIEHDFEESVFIQNQSKNQIPAQSSTQNSSNGYSHSYEGKTGGVELDSSDSSQ